MRAQVPRACRTPTATCSTPTENPRASYLKLHCALCGRIRGRPPRGGAWTYPYIKVCADERALIETWASTELRVRSCHVTGVGQRRAAALDPAPSSSTTTAS